MLGIDSSALVAYELVEHPRHLAIADSLEAARAAGEDFAVTIQVLTEFLHVSTDAKRFANPLSMAAALECVENWRQGRDLAVLDTTPEVIERFLRWMAQHQLGRKRILDTLQAAAFSVHGIERVLTLNAKDFEVFGEFECVPEQAP